MTNKPECIAETGAEVGDVVTCIGHRDTAQLQDFTEGAHYPVILFGTQLCVAPNSTQSVGRRVPRVGYGAYWKLHRRASDKAAAPSDAARTPS